MGEASEQSQSSAAKKKQGQTSKFSLIGKPRGALPVECWEQRTDADISSLQNPARCLQHM
eukprot:4533680-Amphidinium_carterae.1